MLKTYVCFFNNKSATVRAIDLPTARKMARLLFKNRECGGRDLSVSRVWS